MVKAHIEKKKKKKKINEINNYWMHAAIKKKIGLSWINYLRFHTFINIAYDIEILLMFTHY